MKLRDIRRALHPSRLHHQTARYPDVNAECSNELALIADRRRSDIARF